MFASTSFERFLVTRLKYHRPKPTVKKDNFELNTLWNKEGLIVIPDYITGNVLKTLQIECEKAFNSKDKIITTDRDLFDELDLLGVERIFNIQELVPETNQFFNSLEIKDWIDQYANNLKLQKSIHELKKQKAKKTLTDFYHFDEWKPRVKSWLFLNDITEKQGPMKFLKGSHKFGLWRLWREYNLNRYSGYKENKCTELNYQTGSFFDTEIMSLREKYDWEEISLTGKAGTLVLIDHRGLHKSTPLIEGKREVLLQYWEDRREYNHS